MGANETIDNQPKALDAHKKGPHLVKEDKPKASNNSFHITLLAAILALFIAYQHNVNQRSHAQLVQLQSTVGDLLVLVQNQNNLNAPKGILKEFERQVDRTKEREIPHSVYNITPSKDDPSVPADPDREYTYDDFESVFKVEPLHFVKLSPEVKEILENHDIKTDERYLEKPERFDRLAEKYGPLLEKSSEQLHRQTMAVKWFSPVRGFGVIAKRDIKKGEFLGVYGSIIYKNVKNKDYTWTYYTRYVVINGKKERTRFGADGRKQGNYLRFVNHVDSNYGAEPLFVPYKNMWHTIYVARRDIAKGEEITTSYGSGYFETRKLE